MCGKLDHYIEVFTKLRTDKSNKRWAEETTFRAPYNPLLLLSIMDLVATGTVTRNFCEPSFGLAEIFAKYWSQIMPLGSTSSFLYQEEEFLGHSKAPFGRIRRIWKSTEKKRSENKTTTNPMAVRLKMSVFRGQIYPAFVDIGHGVIGLFRHGIVSFCFTACFMIKPCGIHRFLFQ